MLVDPESLHPGGPARLGDPALGLGAEAVAIELGRRIDISATHVTPVHDWSALLPTEVTDDPAARALGSRLSELNATGADVATLIMKVLDDDRPLPAENPAAAVLWRIVGADASTPRPEPKPALTCARSLSGPTRPSTSRRLTRALSTADAESGGDVGKEFTRPA